MKSALVRVSYFLNRTIWKSDYLNDRSIRGRIYATLRILSILIKGFSNNRLLSRAAALSYYSLIGLGPLVAIIVMISGFVLKGGESDLAAQSLNRVLLFIAPPVAELSRLENASPAGPSGGDPGAPAHPADSPIDAEALTNPDAPILNNDLISLINNMIESAQSGTVGVVGAVLLFFIGIQLITSIENTFNGIWSVRRGRSWIQRIVFYWTFITLGAIIGFAGVTVLSASTLIRLFNLLPFGTFFSQIITWGGPLLSGLIIAALLGGFYRFIPNTTVRWKAALAGAFFVTLLLILNNYLSFIYVHRVITQKSLYGSLGIIPVLMVGLYIFWFFILVGGQITYSVQNADRLTHQEAWQNISTHTREVLALAAFLIISRRFKACRPPCSADEISHIVRAPGHILNESLSQLSDLKLINVMASVDDNGMEMIRYQPARPLNQISLGQFRTILRTAGNNTGADLIQQSDPLIEQYLHGLGELTDTEFGSLSIDGFLERSENR